MGPAQWLVTQKEAVDKLISFFPMMSTLCDGTCGNCKSGPCEDSHGLFSLAFNLFCSDLRNQIHPHKYMIVYFREADTKGGHKALN